MQTSPMGVLELCESEAVVPCPYLDSRNIPTFGVGHTKAAGPPDPASMPRGTPENLQAGIERAVEVFAKDLPLYEARVRKAVKVPLNQHQFDALVHWDFNTGGALWRSASGQPCRLIREINAGNYSGDGFYGWLRPPELRKRRDHEVAIFTRGAYDANGDSILIYGADKMMKRTARPIKVIHGRDLLVTLERHGVFEGRTVPEARPSGDPGFWDRPLRETLEQWGLIQ